jgi:hypothetical protein
MYCAGRSTLGDEVPWRKGSGPRPGGLPRTAPPPS